jgi:hypothetical protein
MAAGVVVVLAAFTFAGTTSWNYMQHDNGFCAGCHVMETPFQKFATGAGEHEALTCHDCHQQSIFASTRQLVLWVANRPVEIDDHAPVPDSRCESCHSSEPDTAATTHVRRLAGHRVHFESDSSALDSLLCVTCHGAEVHSFIPSGRTCSGSGCHEQQGITLGSMAELPEISCVTCHSFTADMVPMTTRDSAVSMLMPRRTQCFSCHEMADRLPNYQMSLDPHAGRCSSCHDVHVDTLPSDASTSCGDCHDLASSAFHEGVNHRKVQQDCLTCHQPHQASADASDCTGCHEAVRRQGGLRPPLPFDTAAVLRRRVSAIHDPPVPEPRGKGDVLIEEVSMPPRPDRGVGVVATDSFPHARHTKLACLTCHVVNSPTRTLTFEAPRGCDLCHHQDLLAGRVVEQECAACHGAEALAAPRVASLTVTTAGHAPRARPVPFRHDTHDARRCADCHSPPNVAPADSVASCAGCHATHHESEANCSTCHGEVAAAPQVQEAHTRATHAGCDACHDAARVAELVPTRGFCVTCHEKERDHEAARECTTCHFLEEPASYRTHLLGGKR